MFNDTATTESYTLSLPDALPICEAIRIFNLPDEVLFAVPNRPGTFQADELHPIFQRPFRSDGLVPEVEAKAIGSGLADDPGEDRRCRFEGEIRKPRAVPAIPKQGRAGTALPAALGGMKSKGR